MPVIVKWIHLIFYFFLEYRRDEQPFHLQSKLTNIIIKIISFQVSTAAIELQIDVHRLSILQFLQQLLRLYQCINVA